MPHSALYWRQLAIQEFFCCSPMRQAQPLWIGPVSLEVWLAFRAWLLGQSGASLESVPRSWVFYSQPKLVLACLPVWVTGVQKNLPDHAKLLPNCSLSVMPQEHRKTPFSLFLCLCSLTRRAPSPSLVSMVTLCNMCHVPVFLCSANWGWAIWLTLCSMATRVCVKICICWALSKAHLFPNSRLIFATQMQCQL